MLTKRKKNRKNWKLDILENKWSGDIVETELPTKFGLDPCSVSEKAQFADDGRTDGRLRHDSSSADKVKQS